LQNENIEMMMIGPMARAMRLENGLPLFLRPRASFELDVLEQLRDLQLNHLRESWYSEQSCWTDAGLIAPN
jgi:hypothetical protein